MEKVALRRKKNYKSPNRRRNRIKSDSEVAKEESSQEEEFSSHQSTNICPSEKSEIKKGPWNGQLLGGPVDPSGCPSSITLSRRNSSARPTTKNHQSMPVTSRSKRLRGATTSSQQNHKIAFTDRKTRSASSSLVDSTIVIKNECPSQPFDSLNQENNSPCPTTSNGSDGINYPGKTDISSSEGKGEFEKDEDFSGRSTATQIDKAKAGILSESVKSEAPSETTTVTPSIGTKSTAPIGSSDWNTSTSANVLSNNNDDFCQAEKVIDRQSEKRCEEVKPNGFKSDVVESKRKKSKVVVNDQKLTLAPMLLMNNLPYMGELTFDTRPRRGRKPKKADICHLISKNYGIHFPNSYTNVPNTGTPIPSTSSSYPSNKIITKVSSSVKGKSSKRNSSKSGIFSTCPPPPAWTISPPDLLPISMSGPKNRILSSANMSPYAMSTTSLSLNKIYQSSSKEGANSLIKNTRKKNQPDLVMNKGQEEPLNLCMRDASIISESQPTLTNFNSSYAGIMNLKLPLTSPNSLFSDFHLNQVGSRMSHTSESIRGLNESIRNSRNPTSGNKNAKSNSREKTVSDLSLVNNLNLQLSLGNDFHVNGPILSKSRGKVSHDVRFVPPLALALDKPVCNKNAQIKKARKRRSPTLKPDDSNPIDIKSPLLTPSSSSNIFLNSSSVHPPSSAVSNVESHAGGCLFGQSDSGMNSGAQVSICKFKFTGGAKPSLQEKKMLSVDSGGNFRFYTDKCGSSSVKSLKSCHSGMNPGSSTSFHNSSDNYGEQDCQYAFSSLPKSAKSMSVCMPVRSSSLQTNSSLGPVATASSSRLIEPQKIPPILSVLPAALELHNLHLDTNSRSGSSSAPIPTFSGEDGYSSSQSDNSNSGTGTGPPSENACGSNLISSSVPDGKQQNEGRRSKLARFKRKRRTRKSLMREKLEKTFKEKGFLIQTQQLESAEGATYCKFRQLRKFTRYLFRSWKDYLPDNVRDINAPGANKGEGSGTSINLATSSGGNREGGESGLGMEMELDLTTTNSQDPSSLREDSDEEDNEEDCEGMNVYSGGIPAPQVPSSPLKNPSSNNSNDDQNANDSEVISNDDVDVENIDGTSDNSSPPYNANINIKQKDNVDTKTDSNENT